MQWTIKESQPPTYPTKWRKCFAFFPITLGNTRVWLGWYERREMKQPVAGPNYLFRSFEIRLTNNQDEVWEMESRLFIY